MLTLKRAGLSRALEDEAIRRGVRLEFGKRLTSASETSDGRIVAQFADHAAIRIHLDAAGARLAAYFVLELFFDAALANAKAGNA